MQLQLLPHSFTVCKLPVDAPFSEVRPFHFVSRTDEELSLVCPVSDVPSNVLVREDGWRAFRITGVLDFSLTGILARIAEILAQQKIPIFAISTYNTDYVLLKEKYLSKAIASLQNHGYELI